MHSCCSANEHTFQTGIRRTARSSHAPGDLSGVHTQFSRQAAGASLEQAASSPRLVLQMLPALAPMDVWQESWSGKGSRKAFSPANQAERLRRGQHRGQRLCIYKSHFRFFSLSVSIYRPLLSIVSVEAYLCFTRMCLCPNRTHHRRTREAQMCLWSARVGFCGDLRGQMSPKATCLLPLPLRETLCKTAIVKHDASMNYCTSCSLFLFMCQLFISLKFTLQEVKAQKCRAYVCGHYSHPTLKSQCSTSARVC